MRQPDCADELHRSRPGAFLSLLQIKDPRIKATRGLRTHGPHGLRKQRARKGIGAKESAHMGSRVSLRFLFRIAQCRGIGARVPLRIVKTHRAPGSWSARLQKALGEQSGPPERACCRRPPEDGRRHPPPRRTLLRKSAAPPRDRFLRFELGVWRRASK